MADTAGDRAGQHQEEQGSTPEPTDQIWRIAEGAVQLIGLYYQYKQNEGAAHVAAALVLLINLCRAQS